jgi:hypothetical protein
MSGWQRAGVAASIIWIFIGGYIGSNEVVQMATNMAATDYRLCVDRPGYDVSKCFEAEMREFHALKEGQWGNAVILAFAPLPFCWLFAWMLIATTRWIAAGFSRQKKR